LDQKDIPSPNRIWIKSATVVLWYTQIYLTKLPKNAKKCSKNEKCANMQRNPK